MATRSGRTIDAQPIRPLGAAAIALLLLGVLAGCGGDEATERASAAPAGAHSTADVAPANPGSPPHAEAQAGGSEDMVLIRGGTFVMGDKDEFDAPPHEVTVDSFFMDRHLVTQEQFQTLMGSNPSRWKGAQNPVEQLRWADAAAFCNQRSQAEGLAPCYNLETLQCDFSASGYRLPTEAEWEYACRAGTTTPYFFGDRPSRLGDFAWYDKNAGGHPRPVGGKQPNPWGLYDIVGNVWEWCNDFYGVEYYQQSPRENPRGPADGPNKVLRGGAWKFSADNCRSGYRYSEAPGSADVCFGYDIYGFRCVRRAPDSVEETTSGR